MLHVRLAGVPNTIQMVGGPSDPTSASPAPPSGAAATAAPDGIAPAMVGIGSGAVVYAFGSRIAALVAVPVDITVDRLVAAGRLDSARILVDRAPDIPPDDRAAWTRHVDVAEAHAAMQKLSTAVLSLRADMDPHGTASATTTAGRPTDSPVGGLRPAPPPPPPPPMARWDAVLCRFRDLCVPASELMGYFEFALPAADGEDVHDSSDGTAHGASSPLGATEARDALTRFLTERRSILKRIRLSMAGGGTGNGPPQSPGPGTLPRVTSSSAGSAMTAIHVGEDVVRSMSEAFSEREIEHEQAVVDAALVRVYLRDKSDKRLGSLLRLPNSCQVEATAMLLLKHGKVAETIDFFFGKGEHERALELLLKKATDPATKGNLAGSRALVNYLFKLEALPNELAVLFKYLRWVYQVDEQSAREFVQDTRINEFSIIEFLSSLSPRHSIDYLSYLIEQRGNSSTEIHEEYLRNLIEGVLGESAAMAAVTLGSAGTGRPATRPSHDDDDDETSSESEAESPVGADIRADGSTGDPMHRQEGAAQRRGSDAQQHRSSCMTRLVAFLTQSPHYDPHRVLDRLQEAARRMPHVAALGEACIAIYMRLGDTERALQVLVREMRQIERAASLVEAQDDHYDTLISLCLEADWCDPAETLVLLTRFCDHLEPLVVVDHVAQLDPPLADVAELLCRALVRLATMVHSNAVVKSLAKHEYERSAIELVERQVERVSVDERTTCQVCSRKIGNSAVASWQGTSTVAHLGCMR
ncbi:vacuolar sorting protein 39 domain 1-domain-containing protein [Blastocladiella britannica]|nr:vacuolar sorting protein 39 domain 1-domain-containing protein [Blastocladiella britannica]